MGGGGLIFEASGARLVPTVHLAASAASARPRAARPGGCLRQNFGNSQSSRAGAEVRVGHIQCWWTKSGNLAVVTALVDLSETRLISWFNSWGP
jgi:hypothetical protein